MADLAEDQGSFEAFYGAEVDQAMRLAMLLTSAQDAHDLVQEAFVGLLRNWERTESPRAYLRRSITNGAVNSYRRRDADRDRVAALSGHVSSSTMPTDYLGDLIAGLNPKQRAVVVLRFYLQLRDREIAEALGMRAGSVGPTLTRALRRLRKGMTDDV